jgi:hypothetical protein
MNDAEMVAMNCPTCGAVPPEGEVESSRNGRCSRCAMIAELISELIQKQVRDSSRLGQETNDVSTVPSAFPGGHAHHRAAGA